MGNVRRSISLLVVLGLAAAVLVIVPGDGAGQVGPMAAAQDGYVASTAAHATYDTAELRARNGSAQRMPSYLKFDLPTVSDKLVPREGAWWGSYPGQAAGNVEAREAVYGRQVDVLHRYHDWDDAWPSAEEQAYAARGRLLFEGWENRIFGGATVCWADIAAGGRDAAIDAQAQRLAAFGSRLFVGFMHEPEDNVGSCQPGAVNDPLADMGSVEEFKAAYRHIVERVRPVAPNVVWVLGLMGGNPDLSWTFYPGDDVVDWVAWDPYNWANCAGRANDSWRSVQQVALGMYAHLDAVGNTKPRMLGEYGANDDPAMGSKEQWFRDLPTTLRTAMPKLKALVYFDRLATPVPGDPCAWIVDSSPQAVAGFVAAGADPYLNQPHGQRQPRPPRPRSISRFAIESTTRDGQ
jgi:hypothetical protein